MKKLYSLIICLLFAFQLCGSVSNAQEKTKLVYDFQSFTDSDTKSFLKWEKIEIPEDIQKVNGYEKIVTSIIKLADQDPDYVPEYQYTRMLQMAQAITKRVRELNHTDDKKHLELFEDQNLKAAPPVYQLTDSTRFGAWSNSFLYYNCYGYALNRNIYSNPGVYCHQSIDISKPTSRIADLVLADLRSLGYTSTYATTKPANLPAYKSMIALRKSGTDFHFMKYSGGEWYHKPGNTNPLKYKYIPSNSRFWTNEYIYINTAKPPTQYYTDTIYYITYWSSGGGGTTYRSNLN